MSFFRGGMVIVSGEPSDINLKTDTFTATANQKEFSLSSSYTLGRGRLRVIVGGVEQFAPKNFAETSAGSFTLAVGASQGTDIVAIYY